MSSKFLTYLMILINLVVWPFIILNPIERSGFRLMTKDGVASELRILTPHRMKAKTCMASIKNLAGAGALDPALSYCLNVRNGELVAPKRLPTGEFDYSLPK